MRDILEKIKALRKSLSLMAKDSRTEASAGRGNEATMAAVQAQSYETIIGVIDDQFKDYLKSKA